MTILLMVIFRNYLEPDKTSISCIFKDNYNRRFVFGYTYIYEDIIKESQLWACKCCVLGGIGCTIWEANSDSEFSVRGVY